MKIVTNETLIKRNSQIGFWASLLSPVTMIFSFYFIDQYLGPSLVLFVLGILFFQAGKILRKYGRGADLELNKTLSRLGNEYTLFHFSSPASHLLVGPAGIWILILRYARGTYTYNQKRNKWKLRRKNLFTKATGALREGLGRPDLELLNEAAALDRFLGKHWPENSSLHVNAALVVMDIESEANAPDAPIPTVMIGNLRQLIREQEKTNKIPAQAIKKLISIFKNQ